MDDRQMQDAVNAIERIAAMCSDQRPYDEIAEQAEHAINVLTMGLQPALAERKARPK